MSKLYKTLHKKGDATVEIYPNIERDNIPDKAINYDKLETALQTFITSISNIIDVDNMHITIDTGTYDTLYTDDLNVTNDASINGDLSINNDASINGDLSVSGDTTFDNIPSTPNTNTFLLYVNSAFISGIIASLNFDTTLYTKAQIENAIAIQSKSLISDYTQTDIDILVYLISNIYDYAYSGDGSSKIIYLENSLYYINFDFSTSIYEIILYDKTNNVDLFDLKIDTSNNTIVSLTKTDDFYIQLIPIKALN